MDMDWFWIYIMVIILFWFAASYTRHWNDISITGMSMVFRQCEAADEFSAWNQKQILFRIHHICGIFRVVLAVFGEDIPSILISKKVSARRWMYIKIFLPRYQATIKNSLLANLFQCAVFSVGTWIWDRLFEFFYVNHYSHLPFTFMACFVSFPSIPSVKCFCTVFARVWSASEYVRCIMKWLLFSTLFKSTLQTFIVALCIPNACVNPIMNAQFIHPMG